MKINRISAAVAVLCTAMSAAAVHAQTATQKTTQTEEKQAAQANELAEVVVTGSREELRDVLSPGVVSVVYPDDVKGEHKSIPDLLDQIPGVYVRSLGGSGHYTTASIRGAAPSQVNIYIDGVPLNTASDTAGDLSTLPISNVERVEVYRGVTPARFSGAPIGGAINIVTKKPTTFSGSVSVGFRSFGGRQQSANLNVPLAGGHLLIGLDNDRSKGDFKYTDYRVAGMRHLVWPDGTPYGSATNTPVHYLTGQDIPDQRTRQNNRSEKQNALLKWQNQNFILKYARTDMERDLPERIPPGSVRFADHMQDLPWGYYENAAGTRVDKSQRNRQRQNVLQQEAVAGWNDSFGNLGLAANLTWLDRDQDFRNLDPFNNPRMGQEWSSYDTTRKGISTDATYTLNTGSLNHLIEVHAERYWENLRTDMNNRYPNSELIQDYSRIKTNLQVQDTITIPALGDLQVTPIFRVEKLAGPIIGNRWTWKDPNGGPSGDYNWTRTGSLSLKKDFASGWQAFGSYGNYIRYPGFYEIYGNGLGLVTRTDSIGGVIPMVPEKGRNLDMGLGWDGHLGEQLTGGFRATVFQRESVNEIALYSVPIAAGYVNTGHTRTRGLELEGKLSWSRRADLIFAITRQAGEYTDEDGYHYYGGTSAKERYPGEKVRTLNAPQLAANARLNLHFLDGDLSTFIEGTHIGRVYRDVKSWEDPLSTINLGAHYRFAKGWKLSLGVNDVFNQGPKQTMTDHNPQGVRNGVQAANKPAYTFEPAFCQGLSRIECNQKRAAVPNYVQSVKQNVMYPQQGRSYYATLSYKF